VRQHLGRGLVDPVDPALHDRVEEVLAGREVPVERARPHAGPLGHLVERGVVPLLAEDLPSGLDEAVAVALRVGAHGGPLLERRRKTLSTGDTLRIVVSEPELLSTLVYVGRIGQNRTSPSDVKDPLLACTPADHDPATGPPTPGAD
jgi:hypothetical protein